MKLLALPLIFFAAIPTFANNAMLRALLGSQTQRCVPLAINWTPGWGSNLVAYWQLNGTIGTITNGSSVPATVGPNATAVNGSGNVSYASGVLAQGISTVGNAGDYLSVGNPAAVNDLTSATWMMWVKVPSNTAQTFFYKSDNNGSAGWFFYITNTMDLFFAVVHSTANIQLKADPSPTIANTWTQIVVTWDGTSSASGSHIYLNGTEKTYAYSQNGNGTHSSDAAVALSIGLDGSGASGKNISGVIDEVAIWNRALTPAEVKKLYLNQKCN